MYRTLSAIVSLLAVAISGGTPTQASTAIPACATSHLTLGFGNRVSAMTGEHAVVYTLTNTSKSTCNLQGYPGVSFYGKNNQVLPFEYTRGKSQYMAHSAPATVLLRTRARAYFLVAKYRCDLGDEVAASQIRVYPPNTRQQLVGPATTSNARGIFAYCKGGIKDPGQQIDVSPVRATPRFS